MIQQTSLIAFEQIQPHINRQREYLLTYLKVVGKANNTMISCGTGVPINVVTARMNELRRMGLVILSKFDICPYTKKRTMFWEVKEENARI